MGQFENKVKAFHKRYEKRFRAAARFAVEDTISLAQRVRDEGGTLPVDTGFLRASGQAAIDVPPRGPTQGDKGAKYPAGRQVAGSPVAAVILRWDPLLGQTLIFGWTAAYARRLEYGFKQKDSLGRTYNQQGLGFLRLAVQQWDTTVAKAAEKAKAIQ